MKDIFDYTYYRIAKHYFKKDGLNAITALLTITLIKSLFLMSIFFLIQDTFFFIEKRGKVSILEKIIVVVVLFLIYLYTKKRYKGKYLLLREKWGNEPKKQKQIKGALVVFFILSPLILIVIIAFIFGRTNF